MLTEYALMPSPVGVLLLAGSGAALERLHFSKGSKAQEPDPTWVRNDTAFAGTIRQLQAYFGGRRREFDLLLRPRGTPFELAVWKELTQIPYGATTTYGQIAQRLGKPGASRAVGLANGSNPIAIIQPCHRVIGANGSLTGFGGGLDVKKKLLDLERREQLLFEP